MSADPRRRLALSALLAVQRGRSLEAELRRIRPRLRDDQAVAAVEERVKGVLQWQARYDHLIRFFSSRRPTSDPVVRAILLLAIHELIGLGGVPDHAVLHQAGELCRGAGRPESVRYVNAVLRGIRRHVIAKAPLGSIDAVHELFVEHFADPADYLAAWWSGSEWLVRRWVSRFGMVETEALLRWSSIPPPITLHVLPGYDLDAVQMELELIGLPSVRVRGFPRALRLTDRLDRSRLAAMLHRIGGLLVQDAGPQGVMDWLTRGGEDLAGTEAPCADLCAAPGGKSLHMRALLPLECLLVAMDLRPRRLALVRQNRDRLTMSPLALLVGDGMDPPLRPGCLGAVLVDGPCSGTGVIRRHPEGRWRLRPETLHDNAERLLRLAWTSVDLLVEGGRLYYATCSLEPEENERVIDALLDRRGDLAPDPDPDGRFFRYWLPWRDETDGFFAARLQRQKGRSG